MALETQKPLVHLTRNPLPDKGRQPTLPRRPRRPHEFHLRLRESAPSGSRRVQHLVRQHHSSGRLRFGCGGSGSCQGRAAEPAGRSPVPRRRTRSPVVRVRFRLLPAPGAPRRCRFHSLPLCGSRPPSHPSSLSRGVFLPLKRHGRSRFQDPRSPSAHCCTVRQTHPPTPLPFGKAVSGVRSCSAWGADWLPPCSCGPTARHLSDPPPRVFLAPLGGGPCSRLPRSPRPLCFCVRLIEAVWISG